MSVNGTYQYTEIVEAPPLHREIVRLVAASEGEYTFKDLAVLCNTTENVVKKILSHPPVIRHIELVKTIATHRWRDVEEKAHQNIIRGVEVLGELINDDQLRATERLRAIELATKITPNQPFQHRTTTEVKHSRVADNSMLDDLRRRANAERVKQLRVVDVEVLENPKENAEASGSDCAEETPRRGVSIGTLLEGIQ